MLKLLLAEQPKNGELNRMQSLIAVLAKTAVGAPLPPFQARYTKGEKVSEQLCNKAPVAVFSVWSSTNMQSMEMQRMLNQKVRNAKGKLKVVGLCIDPIQRECKDILERDSISWPNICDGAMFEGDMSRKRTLVDYGFRLPSAMDNRPLKWDEFTQRIGQTVYLSATPGPYELERSDGVVEQIIRPTGLVDPLVVVKPTEGQIDDLLEQVRVRVERDERVLVTTLTKKMAEELTTYLAERGVTTGPEALTTAEEYLAPVKSAGVDTLILGCTHDPLLIGPISYVMGEDVTLVTSSEETAKDVYRELARRDLLRDPGAAPPHHEFRATGDPESFVVLARRFLGPEVRHVSRTSSAFEGASVHGCPETPAGDHVPPLDPTELSKDPV